MHLCDILIVGGGPAGSTCAWKLRSSGMSVVILDKARFPRDKLCGGWITPHVLQELEIDPREYSKGRVFQPIMGFLTGRLGDQELETLFDAPVSYGIRRREFDEYLLRRSGAQTIEATPLETLERRGDAWVANGLFEAPLVVGAGGHFCPVARVMNARRGGAPVVVAQETEFLMNEEQRRNCSVRAEIPELYFCSDMKGYGWCFRKGGYLNVGLGRFDRHSLPLHVEDFVSRLKSARRIPEDTPGSWGGHAYALYGTCSLDPVRDGMLLIGDAAGLACAQSGEGIRPAVESGLLAARVIMEAKGHYTRERLGAYRDRLSQRFGHGGGDWARRISALIPGNLAASLAGRLLARRWFARNILLNRWFLRSHMPPLSVEVSPGLQVRARSSAVRVI